ncbi:hypothetical protein CBER1_10121 [Cercospora berteroae]|uniref:Uncharacterized protein n=1 Tax=Cercospora berteroae TaxID=357750 RepID=A0A2S6CKG0_9PEZI|nr:hypothetical protein CBER1_10121 [Cercospora berteroae]
MASDSDDSLKLRALIEGLPQELQDIIYDMTFTADPKIHIYASARGVREGKLKELLAECSTRVVDLNDGLHPHLLWLDRHSRQKFASSYYGPDSVFAIYGGLEWRVSIILGSHRDCISEPRLVHVGGDNFGGKRIPESMCRNMLVGGGMDAAFASRLIFIKHDEVVKLVKERAGISTEDAEVTEVSSEGERKAED